MKKEKDFLAVVSTQNGVVIKKHYCKSIGEAVSWAKNNNNRDYFELYVFKG